MVRFMTAVGGLHIWSAAIEKDSSMQLWMALLIIVAGGFSIWGAATDQDFFMNSRKARLWVRLMGRNGARVLYILLGVLIIIMGCTAAFAA